jgi:hypothetical protein
VVINTAFWDIAQCSPLKVNVHFRGSVCYLLSRCFNAWLGRRPRRWRRHVPPKRRLTFNGIYGVVSQKTEHFIIHYCFNLTNFLLMSDSDKICHSHNEELNIISKKKLHMCNRVFTFGFCSSITSHSSSDTKLFILATKDIYIYIYLSLTHTHTNAIQEYQVNMNELISLVTQH